MAKIILNGEPGTTWTNNTGKVQYQLIVDWQNSCGLCAQHDHAIGSSWPIPFHRGCRCKQIAIWPGKTSQPFVDFREVISGLDPVQQSRVVGRSNLTLIERGVVDWSDVVTQARVRDFREVVSLKKLSVKEMVGAGVNPRLATEAYAAVNTPAHQQAAAQRKALLDQITAKGITKEQLRKALAERLAARVGIAQGPSGPGASPIKPGAPTPPKKPTPPKPPVLPSPAKKKPKPPKPSPVPLPVPMLATNLGPAPTPTTLQGAYLKSLGVATAFVEKLKAKFAPAPPLPPLPAPKPAPKPEGGFPDSLDGLEVVKTLGGSTGALLVRDPVTGRQYVKKAGANPGHLREEAHADAAYRALGVRVPESRIYEVGGKPIKLSEYLEGKTLAELSKSNPAAAAEAIKALRQDFVADALLGNWDVIGQGLDNVLIGTDGRLFRIDNGGALRYRAQGALKAPSQWSGELGELQSMRSPAVNPSAAQVFAGVTDDEIRKQAQQLLKKREALLASVPAELRTTLEARLKTLEKIAATEPAAGPKLPPSTPPATPVVAPAPAPPKPAPVAKVATPKPAEVQAKPTPKLESWTARPLKDFRPINTVKEMEAWGKEHFRTWARELTREESRSLIRYSGQMHKEMNGLLRGTLDPSKFGMGLSRKTVEDTIKHATAALEKARTPDDIAGYRGIKDLGSLGFVSPDQLAPGMRFTEAAFSSVTLSLSKAKDFAYDGTAKSPAPVVFRVHVPKGSTGAYLNAGDLSGYDDERELLFPPGAEYRVVGHAKPIDKQGVKIPVVILERVQ